MSEASTNLALPYLQSAQAQKHVTVNEALTRLDALVQLSALSATTTAEPGTPADGAVYILPAGKTGAAWDAMADGDLAYYVDGAWQAITPREGWIAFVRDANQVLAFDGAAWALVQGTKLVSLSATDKILGRISSGAGAAEEIAFTDQAQQLCDDASFADMRTTLGLGSAATKNTGTSGASVPLLDAQNDWSMRQDFNGGVNVNDGTTQGGTITLGTGLNGVFSASGGTLTVNGAGYTLAMGGALWRPTADNNTDLGSASFRFQDIFAVNGTIQTSDAREKTPLQPVPESVKRAVRRIVDGVGTYQRRASVAAKGEDAARLHVGVTAQDVAAAFAAEGEDPRRWALFCADALEDEAGGEGAVRMRLGLRYDQLLCLALAVLSEGR